MASNKRSAQGIFENLRRNDSETIGAKIKRKGLTENFSPQSSSESIVNYIVPESNGVNG